MLDHTQYENILESISGGFFALDGEYRITYWNRAAETGTGLKSSEVLGKHVFEVFPNAENAALGDKYRLAMDTKTFQSLETAYKDTRFEAWFDVRIYPAAKGLSVFFQDITEKKREQRQKEILIEISKAINSSTHLDDLCVQAAEKIALLFDIPSKFVSIYLFDHLGREVRLVAPALYDVDFSQEIVHQRVDGGAYFFPAQVAFTKKQIVSDDVAESTAAETFANEIQNLQLRTLIVTPLIVQDEVQGVLEVLTIKEKEFVSNELEILSVIANELASGMNRKRLIDELRRKNVALESQTQKTQEASDTLKKFLATFSHELRSPLNSIIGFSDLLTTQFDGLSPEAVQDFMKNINASGKHLQQIINDILDLSRIEAGKLDLHVASYPVKFFEESVQRVLSAQIAEKEIALDFDLSPEFEEIVVDQTRFKQILINLVSNAIKFSKRKGRVVISSQRVGNDLQFEVRDFGSGIRPEEIQHLFKPFKQAATGRELNQQGIGLGLAITKKLVELHGGSIWIESEYGEGTSVRFKIPLVIDATSERLKQAEMLIDALHREHSEIDTREKPLALIIEDSVQASELLRLHIESAGYRVELARDGAEAIEKAKRLHPNVITLDLMLPVKDGWQVIRELKRHPLCKHIPIIIVSIIDEKNLGFSLGAADYFVKPVNKEDLLATMDRVRLQGSENSHVPKVLVIDDDRAATDLIEVILESEGYEVVKAFHGKEGLDMAVREKPDAIILDLIMPEMSGVNVAYQLRQTPATRSIPIIILTSMDIDEETQQQLGNYVSGLMRKTSFTKRDLLREIGNIESLR
ncbi:MAG: response regulator [Ignavibacteriae bacterium]|nr:response regulator [Ignavibacteriota bacterium]